MPSKKPALENSGCLNPSAKDVRDPRFKDIEFFDPEDLVQVKYEMLRRVQVENGSVVETTRDFGYSRPAYYRTKEQFDSAGLAGLVPKKRGPKGGHKLTETVVDFLAQLLDSEPKLGAQDLAARVEEEFDLRVHARSIERALSRRKKNSS